jgi:hypothetical protein
MALTNSAIGLSNASRGRKLSAVGFAKMTSPIFATCKHMLAVQSGLSIVPTLDRGRGSLVRPHLGPPHHDEYNIVVSTNIVKRTISGSPRTVIHAAESGCSARRSAPPGPHPPSAAVLLGPGALRIEKPRPALPLGACSPRMGSPCIDRLDFA